MDVMFAKKGGIKYKMTKTTKKRQYTTKQRQICHKITLIQQKQTYHRNRWLDLDVKLFALKHKLKESVKR